MITGDTRIDKQKCTECHRYSACKKRKETKDFAQRAETCRACKMYECEGCRKEQRATAYESDVMESFRKRGTKLICQGCAKQGHTRHCVDVVECKTCLTSLGHLRFDRSEWIKARRATRVACKNCEDRRERELAGKLRKTACKCISKCSGFVHVPQCPLFGRGGFRVPPHPGLDTGVSAEDVEFLKRRKPLLWFETVGEKRRSDGKSHFRTNSQPLEGIRLWTLFHLRRHCVRLGVSGHFARYPVDR